VLHQLSTGDNAQMYVFMAGIHVFSCTGTRTLLWYLPGTEYFLFDACISRYSSI
jgi:hypothetical protein